MTPAAFERLPREDQARLIAFLRVETDERRRKTEAARARAKRKR